MALPKKQVDRHRPMSFPDIKGQHRVVDWFRAEVRSGRGSGAILHGEPGLGKTSAAGVYARALLCRQVLPDASPCGQCRDCLDFDGDYGNASCRIVDCSRDGRVEALAAELENLRHSSLFNPRQVLILDEADQMRNSAVERLKIPLEDPKLDATILLLTNKPQDLTKAILSRGIEFKFSPLSFEESLRHLKQVCEVEGFKYEMDALELIADHTGGYVRDLLHRLDQISTLNGTVITADVRKTLSLDYVDTIVQFMRVALSGDLQGQIRIIEAWMDGERTKVNAIQRLLIYLFTTEVLRLVRTDPLMASILPADKEWIVGEMAARTVDFGLSAREFWQETVDWWNPPMDITKASLLAKVVKFDAFLNFGCKSTK